MASVDNVPRTANLAVNFAAPAGPTLKSISTVPTAIVAGANATGTVSFTGAMNDGAVVNLTACRRRHEAINADHDGMPTNP